MVHSEEKTLVSSAARTVSGNSSEFPPFAQNYLYAVFLLNISAVSGTLPTLDVVVQERDPISGNWVNAYTFPQQTATGLTRLTAQVYGNTLRVAWTIGGTTPSFTFSVSGVFKTP